MNFKKYLDALLEHCLYRPFLGKHVVSGPASDHDGKLVVGGKRFDDVDFRTFHENRRKGYWPLEISRPSPDNPGMIRTTAVYKSRQPSHFLVREWERSPSRLVGY